MRFARFASRHEYRPEHVILRGWASTCDLDLSRTKTRHYAFGLSPSSNIPLCYKHGDECGKVRFLTYPSKSAAPSRSQCHTIAIPNAI